MRLRKSMRFEDLEQLVIKWAKDRSIIGQSSTQDLYRKLYEEFRELGLSVGTRYYPETNRLFYTGFKDKELTKDAIGDMLVVLTIIAELNNLTLSDCYEAAYIEIKDRKGKMVNGLFVKEI